jgi:hypothetical protein
MSKFPVRTRRNFGLGMYTQLFADDHADPMSTVAAPKTKA